MRTEKGWYCFSEVHIKRAFTAGFVELLKYVNSMWYYGMYIVINPRYQDLHIIMYSLFCIYYTVPALFEAIYMEVISYLYTH